MDRRERERILGEHGPREQTVLERRLADRLDDDLEGSPLVGRPLPTRLRNFSLSADRYTVALAGPPSYARRLREIEDETAAHEQALRDVWRELRRRHAGDPHGFAQRWRRLAERWSFHAVNELIERHNAFYPAEARLAMDPHTGDFVLVGGAPYSRRPLDSAWVLQRFPAEHPAAAGAVGSGSLGGELAARRVDVPPAGQPDRRRQARPVEHRLEGGRRRA